MPYSAYAFLSVCIFAFVHLWAEKTRSWPFLPQSKFLSTGGGVAIAYVFVDLLPKLGKNDQLVRQALSGVFPYFEKHVYVMALLGFLLFFFVSRKESVFGNRGSFWLSLFSYALFNFLVGYAVVDKNNPEVRPLALFTFAIALHYFVNDYSLSKEQSFFYDRVGKWMLIIALFLGWLLGLWIQLPKTSVALVSAFIGGGVIMNVTRHELPVDNPNDLSAFIISALTYAAVLLALG